MAKVIFTTEEKTFQRHLLFHSSGLLSSLVKLVAVQQEGKMPISWSFYLDKRPRGEGGGGASESTLLLTINWEGM